MKSRLTIARRPALAWIVTTLVALVSIAGVSNRQSVAYSQVLTPRRTVNIPYFSENVAFSEMAVFWFGKVTPSENYADVRVGYNDEELQVYVAIFDRRLWYDTTPTSGTLTDWDAVTLLLDVDSTADDVPQASSYRLVAEFSHWQARPDYQTAFQGDGIGWQAVPMAFTTEAGWRGDAPNNDVDDRGWTVMFRIPFASLARERPSDGESWRGALILHDRDSAADTPTIADKRWPEEADSGNPTTWSSFVFNPAAYLPPRMDVEGTTVIRDGLAGAEVTDAAAGGYTICGEGVDFWTDWGHTNEGFYNEERSDFNIQNQADIADWPCFSKYYVTFPLDLIPANKAIHSATLTLHQYGNAGDPADAAASYVQVFSVAELWDELTLTWNNAPLALENVSASWVDALDTQPAWPGVARSWDISAAVAKAYETGSLLQLALYSGDSAYHSGKYFVSSDTGEWNAVGRPSLTVDWGSASDTTNLSKIVHPALATTGDTVTYDLRWKGTGSLLTVIDVLPPALGQLASLQASSGQVEYDQTAQRITWTGTPEFGETVTLSFTASIATDGPAVVRNTATVNAIGGVLDCASAVVFVINAESSGSFTYLPLLRGGSGDRSGCSP